MLLLGKFHRSIYTRLANGPICVGSSHPLNNAVLIVAPAQIAPAEAPKYTPPEASRAGRAICQNSHRSSPSGGRMCCRHPHRVYCSPRIMFVLLSWPLFYHCLAQAKCWSITRRPPEAPSSFVSRHNELFSFVLPLILNYPRKK